MMANIIEITEIIPVYFPVAALTCIYRAPCTPYYDLPDYE